MENRNFMNLKEFTMFYKNYIVGLKIKLNSTIASILSERKSSIIDINVCQKGTKINYENVQVNKGTYIDYVENIVLNIGIEEIMYMYNNCDWNLTDSFNKLVTHEFLHVLFGDFTKPKLNYCYNFSNGSLKSHLESSLENNPFYCNSGKEYDDNGYEKIDRKVFNIAGDFVINRELDIIKPFLRAEDYGLPADLTTFEYYAILKRDDETLSLIMKDINPLNFLDEDVLGKDGSNTEAMPISNSKMASISSEDLIEDLFLGKDRGLGPSNIDFVIKKLKKKNSIFIGETKKMINQIKADTFNNKCTPTSKKDSWFKFNNRKDDTDNMIFPGKEQKRDSKSKNLEHKTIPVIFIDCSGSMLDIMKELFYFCYHLLKYINCTLVFYDTSILKVFNCANDVNFNPSMFMGGGTDVKAAIKEYKENYNKDMNNIYIFTDGYDDFSNLDVTYADVYVFDKSGVTKMDIDRLEAM